ncbi:hypothetical protein EDB85DRAFT_2273817 [Lactarius pseudohatsudake]|nr:hypothetical protein EDB85DRAFT_2273817 [Lactarius pseudohatsudake]
MKLTSTIISLAAFFSVASADNVRFNTFYDNPQTLLNNVACSNGNNGLVTKGFPTFAMSILTNGQAQKLDVVNAQATQVDNSFCGLTGVSLSEENCPSNHSGARGGASNEDSFLATKLSVAGDEALPVARQLSDEINGRSRASRSSAASGASSTPETHGRRGDRGQGRGRGQGGRANGARSADTIDDSGNEGSNGDESKKRKGGGLSKAYNLRSIIIPLSGRSSRFRNPLNDSEPLAALVEESLSRPQVVKRRAYIKSNKLQNPSNGREILCDNALRAVFNTDKIVMFKMNKELGK